MSSTAYGLFSAVAGGFTATGSYDALASYTVPSGGVSSITFAGLPTGGQYKHLQLRINAQHSSNAVSTQIALNDDTTTGNYNRHVVYGSGGSVYAFSEVGTGSPRSLIYINNVSSAPIIALVDFVDYSNTSKLKTLRSSVGRYSSSDQTIAFESKLWKSTNAINKITLTIDSGTITEFSKFSLYGLKG